MTMTIRLQLIKLNKVCSKLNLTLRGGNAKVKDSVLSIANAYSSIDISNTLKTSISDVVNKLNLKDDLDPEELEKFSSSLGKLQEKMQKL